MHRLLQFATHRKNLVCIPKHCVPEFGQHEISTETFEELVLEERLELRQLFTNRRVGQTHLCRGPRDAAFAGNELEIVEVVVVEPLHNAPGYVDCVPIPSGQREPARVAQKL